ncbi:nucleotide-binding domain-containing protein [Shewanella baltica]|uniref:nucleotide-binding domain-containing protein n=1 Tax=Shewanella baltica TaxID=62322 RepID=UPI0032184756
MSITNLDEVTKKYFSDIREGLQSRALNSSYSDDSKSSGMESIACESYNGMYKSAHLYKKKQLLQRLDSKVIAQQEYVYQNTLRPWFNKLDVNKSKVGPHPDFAHLKETNEVEFNQIVTMFVDIKRSSRLSLLMSLQDAYVVKNRILQTCVDVIRALDGYPHRLMGDAVMAFFGGKNLSPEDSIANALNASSSLKLILTESVFPQLNELLGKDVSLGVRIGLDYGSNQEVIWANYGYGDASEVTALGLPVDLASKAQSQANTNTAMLGQGILDFVDFPEMYSEIKTVGADKSPECYILPNMEDVDGKPINRRCRLLKMDMYQDLLPIPLNWRVKDGRNLVSNDDIKFKCYYKKNDSDEWMEYNSVSFFLEKNITLKFEIEIYNPDKYSSFYPLVAKFEKNNYGKEAEKGEDHDLQSVTKHLIEKNTEPYQSSIVIDIPEGTAYRGLHTMEVVISPKSNQTSIIYKNIIGVYIK